MPSYLYQETKEKHVFIQLILMSTYVYILKLIKDEIVLYLYINFSNNSL